MRILSVLTYIVDLLASILMIALGIRLAFKLFNANTANTFVSWVYDTTQPIIAPFSGIFQDQVINSSYVLEATTLLALVAVAVVGFLIVQILTALQHAFTRSTSDDDLVRNGRIITPRRRASDRPDAHVIS